MLRHAWAPHCHCVCVCVSKEEAKGRRAEKWVRGGHDHEERGTKPPQSTCAYAYAGLKYSCQVVSENGGGACPKFSLVFMALRHTIAAPYSSNVHTHMHSHTHTCTVLLASSHVDRYGAWRVVRPSPVQNAEAHAETRAASVWRSPTNTHPPSSQLFSTSSVRRKQRPSSLSSGQPLTSSVSRSGVTDSTSANPSTVPCRILRSNTLKGSR